MQANPSALWKEMIEGDRLDIRESKASSAARWEKSDSNTPILMQNMEIYTTVDLNQNKILWLSLTIQQW